MRTISQSTLQSMLSEDTQHVYLMLLDIDHSTLAEPLRFVNNNEDVIHNGNTYQWYPFKISLPGDSEEQVKVQIEIDNVSPEIMELLRSIKTKPDITIRVVVLEPSEQSPPETNDVEVGPIDMKLKRYDADAATIRGTVEYQADFLNQKWPKYQFTPQTAPGMFT